MHIAQRLDGLCKNYVTVREEKDVLSITAQLAANTRFQLSICKTDYFIANFVFAKVV